MKNQYIENITFYGLKRRNTKSEERAILTMEEADKAYIFCSDKCNSPMDNSGWVKYLRRALEKIGYENPNDEDEKTLEIVRQAMKELFGDNEQDSVDNAAKQAFKDKISA